MIYYQESVSKSTHYNTLRLSTPTTETVRDIILKEVDQYTWRIVNNNVSAVVARSVRTFARSNVWEDIEEYFKKKQQKNEQ